MTLPPMPQPDTHCLDDDTGKDVWSHSADQMRAYAELAVPIISPEMNIPFVHNLEAQVAGRYEHYSDFGDVAKPKVAMAWDLFDGLRVRASYSEGFRAPNLEQTNARQYGRLTTNPDYIRCEADLRAKRIATFGACSRSIGASLLVSGNPELEPEESTNTSYGVVFQPKFVKRSSCGTSHQTEIPFDEDDGEGDE